MNELFSEILKTGGLGALLLGALKWFVSSYFKSREKYEQQKDENFEKRFTRLEMFEKDISIKLDKFKDDLRDYEIRFMAATTKLEAHSGVMKETLSAFKGFVSTSEKRFQELEKTQSEVIELSETLRLVKAKLKGG